MQDTAKYLVHADITAEGVVERSDVVGAVFGQTEGLLGDELDLRELQDSSKVGRIDVEIDSQNGQSFGRITIATSLDQVETAILAAALETIDRVGPCRSTIEVRKIEDVRAAKRREVVERAKSLLGSAFEDSMRSSSDLVREVRESVRIEDITEYEGFPAGPRVEDSDAIIVVEGRADVLTLLQYGIKNAVAVEGTNVPDAIADLTESRTVTAFLDGDRGGELIRRELAQVGNIDYVASAPEGRSVEDLARHEVMTALREKVRYERSESETEGTDRPASRTATGSDSDAEGRSPPPEEAAGGSETNPPEAVSRHNGDRSPAENIDGTALDDPGERSALDPEDAPKHEDRANAEGETEVNEEAADSEAAGTTDEEPDDTPGTLRGHSRAVIGEETGRVRLLDEDFGTMADADAESAFELLEGSDRVPFAVVVDGELSQRLLDIAAQRGVDHVVAATVGEFVKRPTSVRVRSVDQLLATSEA